MPAHQDVALIMQDNHRNQLIRLDLLATAAMISMVRSSLWFSLRHAAARLRLCTSDSLLWPVKSSAFPLVRDAKPNVLCLPHVLAEHHHGGDRLVRRCLLFGNVSTGFQGHLQHNFAASNILP